MQASWAEGITLQSIHEMRRAGRTRNPTFMFPLPPKQGRGGCIQSGHVFRVGGYVVCIKSKQLWSLNPALDEAYRLAGILLP
jgi:hypothetical protein